MNGYGVSSYFGCGSSPERRRGGRSGSSTPGSRRNQAINVRNSSAALDPESWAAATNRARSTGSNRTVNLQSPAGGGFGNTSYPPPLRGVDRQGEDCRL